jgi:capsid assembly protease
MSERGLAAIAAAANTGTSTAAIEAATRSVAPPQGGAATVRNDASAAAAVDHTAALASARGEGKAEGVSSERTRIKAIMTSAQAKGREQLAQSLAFNTDLPAEQAITVLGDAPEAVRGSRLDGLVPQPKVAAEENNPDPNAAARAGLAGAVQRQIERAKRAH